MLLNIKRMYWIKYRSGYIWGDENTVADENIECECIKSFHEDFC
jgi:hypothetical protein